MKTSFKILLAAFALAMPFLSGCNDGGPSTKMFVKSANGHRMRIAVLPFDNVSKETDAGRIVTNTVVTYLLSTGDFDVVEPGMVNATLASENIRLTDGITPEIAQKLQSDLNADAFVMGMVEDYGEVRVGADTYPSISFSARLVDARTADILWAATISKTGADKVKVFDIGRISSLGKLSNSAVGAMAASLARSRKEFNLSVAPAVAAVANAPATPAVETPAAAPVETPAAPVTPAAPETPAAVETPAPQPAPQPTPQPTPQPVVETPAAVTPAAVTPAPVTGGARYQDETAKYGEKELTALLKDTNAGKLSEKYFKKHYHDTVEAKYTLPDKKTTVEVKLVDYRNAATSEKFLQGYNPSAKQTSFDNLPAFTGETGFGYYHLDLAAGRFGLYLRGPKGSEADIDTLGKTLVGLLK